MAEGRVGRYGQPPRVVRPPAGASTPANRRLVITRQELNSKIAKATSAAAEEGNEEAVEEGEDGGDGTGQLQKSADLQRLMARLGRSPSVA